MIIIDWLMCKELSNANRNVELSAINRGVRDVAGKARSTSGTSFITMATGFIAIKLPKKFG